MYIEFVSSACGYYILDSASRYYTIPYVLGIVYYLL